MTPKRLTRLWSLGLIGLVAGHLSPVSGQEATAKVSREKLIEPVFRVTKQESPTITAPAALVKPAVGLPPKTHPLDGPLAMAHQALARCERDIADYTGVIVKRERISGNLNDECYMLAKIRHEQRDANNYVRVPFSVYLKFLKPGAVKGREVIYVKGQNNGKLIAHEGGFKGKFTPSLYLDPNGTLAMMGQRYPITDIGIMNLCSKLIERGNRDRTVGNCQVRVTEANINKRAAKRIELIHPQRRPGLDFHIARIFVDNEYQIPVRYEAYNWPKSGTQVGRDELIEEYTYIRLKFNVGLTDDDFNPKNPAYNM